MEKLKMIKTKGYILEHIMELAPLDPICEPWSYTPQEKQADMVTVSIHRFAVTKSLEVLS